jgi:hypothetical protein
VTPGCPPFRPGDASHPGGRRFESGASSTSKGRNIVLARAGRAVPRGIPTTEKSGLRHPDRGPSRHRRPAAKRRVVVLGALPPPLRAGER